MACSEAGCREGPYQVISLSNRLSERFDRGLLLPIF
jgi:hypothetical protein